MSRSGAPIHLPQQLPDVMQALLAVQSQIDAAVPGARLKHLAVLRASQINRCAYCVDMHAREARDGGETSQRLDRLVVWQHAADYSPRERAALAWAEALTELDPHTQYDPLRAELSTHFTETQVAALTAMVAMINLWNRLQVANH